MWGSILALLLKVFNLFVPTKEEKTERERKDNIGKVHDAVNQGSNSRGDMSDLDDLLS